MYLKINKNRCRFVFTINNICGCWKKEVEGRETNTRIEENEELLKVSIWKRISLPRRLWFFWYFYQLEGKRKTTLLTNTLALFTHYFRVFLKFSFQTLFSFNLFLNLAPRADLLRKLGLEGLFVHQAHQEFWKSSFCFGSIPFILIP